MIFDILFTDKMFIMAHTADVKLWSTFPRKKRYFSLVYCTKIEKNRHFLVFWALIP